MKGCRFSFALLAALGCASLACDHSQMIPDPPAPWPPAAQTPPENLLRNLVTIYSDTEHTAAERLAAYEELLLHASTDPPGPGFQFNFPTDIEPGYASWGLDAELAAHERLFAAQADATIYSLDLRLTCGATEPIVEDPERAGCSIRTMGSR